MLQRLRGNQKGFTLIELMIVIAIIGILAAIAVPQFMAYRMRGYHSVSASDLRNFVAGQAALYEDGATYGMVEFTQVLNTALGSGPLAQGPNLDTVAGGLSVGESGPAPAVGAIPGTMLTGTRNVANQAGGWAPVIFAFPISVGDGVKLTTSLSISAAQPLYQDSFTMFAEHIKGIRSFGSDSDISGTIYFAENELWNEGDLSVPALDCTPYQANFRADDIFGQVSGGPIRNPNWQVMK